MSTRKEDAVQKRKAKQDALDKLLGEMKPENRERIEKVIAARDVAKAKASENVDKLSEEYKQRLEAWQIRDALQDAVVNEWVVEIEVARKKYSGVKKAYREGQYEAVGQAYSIYNRAEDKDFGDLFYNKLAERLREAGVKIQNNTTDAALVVRYIWGPTLSPAQVFKYGSTLRYARGEMVKPEDFVEWLKRTTITKAAEAENAANAANSLRKERMNRARVVIMRYLELREVDPFAKVPMHSWTAERYLSNGTNLHLMLGTAVRRMDRESDYADLLISAILPPNINLDMLIIDRFAKQIVDDVERYEIEIDEKEAEVWADDLFERLWQAEYDESKKANEYWATRQQAALAESQTEFVKKIRKKKMADKSKKK